MTDNQTNHTDDILLEDEASDEVSGRDDLTGSLPGFDAPDTATESASTPYQVLARKYRPRDFADLVGQDAMVRTLTNAFASGRLAHAFILTGVRGVGKTTTARIIARALNCVGPDGTGGPTITPCGVCEHCKSITEDRHVDVLEMDAASRTGVDDIRELIDGARYRPVSARYKVYIIDEVHMLSRNAFNALLKTLEEPPEHVKFIFATTEIRRVPITVLSRCQRFDLRRIDADTLAADFARIAKIEGAQLSDAAIALIARAADGSHRDGLSILDQAIATGARDGRVLDEDEVRTMLGLADRTRSFDLLEAVFRGDAAGVLQQMEDDYHNGADPVLVFQDLLEITHWLTRIKLAPTAADAPTVPEAERVRGRDMADKLGMAALARAWQMLLKGLREVQTAPSPIQAADMALVRLAYAAELPTPAEAIKTLQGNGGQAPKPSGTTAPPAMPSSRSGGPAAMPAAEPVSVPTSEEAPRAEAMPVVTSFADVIALAEAAGEAILKAQLINNVRLVRFEKGRIEFGLVEGTPPEIVANLAKFLHVRTGERWMVSLSQEQGSDTMQQRAAAAATAEREEAAKNPVVKSILDAFPGASIEEVRHIGAAPVTSDSQITNEFPETDGDQEGETGL